MAAQHKLEQEVDANYDAFRRKLSSYMIDHAGQVALMRGGEIIGFFEEVNDALTHARAQFPDHIFSVQPVEDEPVDLGYFSHAGS